MPEISEGAFPAAAFKQVRTPGNRPISPDEPWMATQSGGRCYPQRPTVSEFTPEDISHALGNICRFGGHTREFYSVAQHCLFVADIVDRLAEALGYEEQKRAELRLYALLHDASEAYIGDMPRPVKRVLPDYVVLEREIMDEILLRYGLTPKIPDIIWLADDTALVTEAYQLLPNTPIANFGFDLPPQQTELRPWGPREAARSFGSALDAALARLEQINGPTNP